MARSPLCHLSPKCSVNPIRHYRNLLSNLDLLGPEQDISAAKYPIGGYTHNTNKMRMIVLWIKGGGNLKSQSTII